MSKIPSSGSGDQNLCVKPSVKTEKNLFLYSDRVLSMQELTGVTKSLAPRRGRASSRPERKTRQSDQERRKEEAKEPV